MIENIVLDWGYVLAYPATGNWIISPKTKEILGTKNMLRAALHSKGLQKGIKLGFDMLNEDHLLMSEEKEIQQFIAFYDLALQNIGVKHDRKHLAEDLARDIVTNPEHVNIYNDTLEEIQNMKKNHRVMILSDNWPSLRTKMRNTKVDTLINEVVISCEYGICKDNTKLFEIAVEKWGINTENSVFVDDSMKNLVNSQAIGFKPILMDRTGKVTQCDYPIAHNLTDVISIVEGMN